ncbi:chalcone isomerase family protein [Burkholderiaceae bacterium FT117]|uniref:chalcone isomerase family protein n=1 Tax=Zeimonas sediminis TaxID=2944268 RepID=UPI002342CC64|nr:chalcone isomerase family protein [Zeimonas sediminis]MCM5570959.1 chalcone isomerase family protein [Zeimonas sediminis]
MTGSRTRAIALAALLAALPQAGALADAPGPAGAAGLPAAVVGRAPAVADAAAAAGLPESARAALGAPSLAGAGTLRWFGFRVYDAQLWTGGEGLDPRDPTSRPFALELRYARTLSGDAIADRSAEEIARLGRGDAEARQAWHAAMRRLFPDVSEGDRILGLHRPGGAARFYLNGRLLGEVEDPRFGPAFFAIWLDPATVAPALREALLGPAAQAMSR